MSDYEIRVIGARPGEKLHERLITDDEQRRTRAEPGGLYVVEPHERVRERQDEGIVDRLDSSQGTFLTKAEIRGLLVRGGALPAFGGASESDSEISDTGRGKSEAVMATEESL